MREAPGDPAMITEIWPEVLTVDEAAAYLQIATITLYRLLIRGRCPGRQCGRQWRIRRADLDAWVKQEGR